MLDVNPLLRELILRIVAWPADAPLDAARARIVDTLLDEFAAAPSRPMPLPMPSDRRLRPIAAELLKNPACGLSIENGAAGSAPADGRWRACSSLKPACRSRAGARNADCCWPAPGWPKGNR